MIGEDANDGDQLIACRREYREGRELAIARQCVGRVDQQLAFTTLDAPRANDGLEGAGERCVRLRRLRSEIGAVGHDHSIWRARAPRRDARGLQQLVRAALRSRAAVRRESVTRATVADL